MADPSRCSAAPTRFRWIEPPSLTRRGAGEAEEARRKVPLPVGSDKVTFKGPRQPLIGTYAPTVVVPPFRTLKTRQPAAALALGLSLAGGGDAQIRPGRSWFSLNRSGRPNDLSTGH